MKKLLIIILFSLSTALNAQSLNGLTGYYKIPTAYISVDGQLSIGTSIFNKRYQQYSGYQNHVFGAYLMLGYFPRVEISLRITRKINSDYTSHVMDRMFSGKFLLFEEGRYIPAFSLGLQNPYSTLESANHFNSTYFVISKSIELSSILSTSLTIGRGFDWVKAADHEFIGFFGGTEISIQPIEAINVSVILENTGLITNVALRLILFRHFQILAGFEGLDALSIGSAIIINL